MTTLQSLGNPMGAILFAGRCATLLLGLGFLALSMAPGAAQPAKLECVKMLEERLKIIEAPNKLESVELPIDKIRDLLAFIAELKSRRSRILSIGNSTLTSLREPQ